MAQNNSRIYRIAGLSLLGFCAVSIGVDRADIGPVAQQVAGFCGAFAGALAGRIRRREPASPPPQEPVHSIDPKASTD